MGLFGEDTKKTQLGECMSCGKPMYGKVGKESGEIKSTPDATLKDGTFMCMECVKSKGFASSYDVSDKTKAELLKLFKKKGFVSPDKFTPTKRVHRLASIISPRSNYMYLEIDEGRELINIPYYDKGIMYDDLCDWVIPWSKILDFKVIDSGSQIMEGASLLGAAVGGALFGGAGAIVGSSLAGRSMSGKCKDLLLKVIIDDLKTNTRYIHFLGKDSEFTNVDRDSGDYSAGMAKAEECVSLLTIILRRNQEKKMAAQVSTPSATDTNSGNEDIIGTIKKLAELRDYAIISEEEFEKKKAELMARL